MRRSALLGAVALAGGLLLAVPAPSVAAPVDPSLRAYWNFDQAATCTPPPATIADVSGQANPLTLESGAVLTTAAAPVPTLDPVNCALNLGGGKFADAADANTLDLGGSFSIAAWARDEASGDGGIRNIVSKDDASGPTSTNYNVHLGSLTGSGADRVLFAMTFTDQATLSGITAGDGATAACDAGGCIVAGATPVNTGLHHVAAVYNDTLKKMSVYLDGVLDGSAIVGTTGHPLTNDQTVQLGMRKAGGGNALNGQIDEVRIYDGLLAPAAIGALADYRNFSVTLGPDAIMKGVGMGDQAYTANVTISPAVSFIPVHFSLDGTEQPSSPKYTRAGGTQELFTFNDDGVGNIDVVRAWIDTDRDGALTTAPPADPQDAVNVFWVNTPGGGSCVAANQVITEYDVIYDSSGAPLLLYSEDIHIAAPFSAPQNACIYTANVSGSPLTLSSGTNYIAVRTVNPYTPKGSGATFDRNGMGGTLAPATDYLHTTLFTNISLHKGSLQTNAHLVLPFQVGTGTFSAPIDVHFQG